MKEFELPEGTIIKINGFPYRLKHDTTIEGDTDIGGISVDGLLISI